MAKMDLRSKMLSSGKKKEKEITVDILGDKETIIVKSLTLTDRDRVHALSTSIKKTGSGDEADIQVEPNYNKSIIATIIMASYKPNGERIFEEADLDLLMGLDENTQFIDDIYDAVRDINKIDEEEIKEGLDETQKSK